MANSPGPLLGTLSTMGDSEQLTTTRIIRDAARSMGDQRITHCTIAGKWEETTYAATWERIRRMSAGLREMGIGPGDHVGLLLWNDLRHFESYFSVPLLGATMIQLNPRLSPTDLAYVITHSRAKTIVIDATLFPLAEGLAPHLGDGMRWIVAADGGIPEQWASRDDAFSYEDLVSSHDPISELPDIDERTASGGCYSTGTTGRPKGVLYSHRSTWLHSLAIASSVGMTMWDAVMFLTPMFHVQCWGLPYAATAVGARIVLPGRFTVDDMPRVTDALLDNGVTVAPAAPAILMPMLRHLQAMEAPPRMDNVRLICGATEPPLFMMREFDRLTGAEVIHAYGATETSPLVSANRTKPTLADKMSEEELWNNKRFQGLPAVGVDLKIVGDDGTVLPPGKDNVGEVRVRGPWITRSYVDNPEASEAGFDEDGYWRSGDVGYLTEDGYLKVSDRSKDIIKSGGEWISSIDMENQLVTLPEIIDAAVVGVAHPKWEERPIALVVLAPGATVTEEKITTALLERFSRWQLPDRVLFVDSLPRTGVGKVSKKELREKYHDLLLNEPS